MTTQTWEEIEAELKEKFSPFIMYRVAQTAVDLGKNADITTQQLEHCEEAFREWLRQFVEAAHATRLNDIKELKEEVGKMRDRHLPHDESCSPTCLIDELQNYIVEDTLALFSKKRERIEHV